MTKKRSLSDVKPTDGPLLSTEHDRSRVVSRGFFDPLSRLTAKIKRELLGRGPKSKCTPEDNGWNKLEKFLQGTEVNPLYFRGILVVILMNSRRTVYYLSD